jgi:hypothetical protein
VLSSTASLAEKIYVQTDNDVYTADQTVWFKVLVTNAAGHTPTQLSNVLYVELIDPTENTVEKKIIKLTQGTGDSFFQLTKTYAPGIYQVRGYTEWNKNFGQRFVFRKYIRIFATENSYKESPITNVKLVEGSRGDRRLNVQFLPQALDSLAGKEFLLYLTLDEKKDTLSIKRNDQKKFLLDYALPEKCRFVTLNLQTTNLYSYTKTIALDTTSLDFRFFPESGEMVHGLPTLLGLKVLDYMGKGRAVAGEILNRQGKPIAVFKTNKLGMGTVELARADSQEQYQARIFSPGDSALQIVYPLPFVVAKGNSLTVRKQGSNIRLSAASTYLANDSVLVRAACRGVVYYDLKGQLKKGRFSFSFPAHALPEGIICFTLMRDSTHPLAERLYFNERPENRIGLSVFADKESYGQREQTTLVIETKNREGQVLPATFSVLVLNHSHQQNMSDTRQNILSYFLVGADLNGDVEDPGFYFTKDASRHADLDALLLTQGWRNYKYVRDTAGFRFMPESTLSVSGTVKGGLFSGKQKKNAALTMMTFGPRPYVLTQETDSLGRFYFPLNEEYGQALNILIQSANKSGKQKDYTILLDRKEPLPVFFQHSREVVPPDSMMQAYVQKHIERKKAEDAFSAATEGRTMDRVVVKAYAMTPERKKVTDEYGKAKVVIDGRELREKEAKWSYGLYSVLLFNFPDKISIVRAPNGNLYARHYNREPTLVVIDGIPVPYYDYGLIPSIPTSEVRSFEIIEFANNFRSLFCTAIPEGCGIGAPTTGNVIAIYTYGGKGLFGVQPSVGILKTEVPVFAATREFYAPKYENLKPEDWRKPDLRSLIYWAPQGKTDSLGRATVSFYNADPTGTMQVIVEAISATGELGYLELQYAVRPVSGKRHLE